MRAPILGWCDAGAGCCASGSRTAGDRARKRRQRLRRSRALSRRRAAPHDALHVPRCRRRRRAVEQRPHPARPSRLCRRDRPSMPAGAALRRSPPFSSLKLRGRDAVLARHRFHGGTAASFEEFLSRRGRRRLGALHRRRLGRFSGADWRRSPTSSTKTIVLGGRSHPVRLRHGAGRGLLRRHLLPNHPAATGTVDAQHRGPAIGAPSMLHQSMFSIDEELVVRGRTFEASP